MDWLAVVGLLALMASIGNLMWTQVQHEKRLKVLEAKMRSTNRKRLQK